MPIDPAMPVFTPDDIMEGDQPSGHVVIYDDDHYYMGGVLAELLCREGCRVTIATPAALLSEWTVNTLEQESIHRRLAKMDVAISLNSGVTGVGPDHVVSNCAFTDRTSEIGCDGVVLVTSRTGNDGLF